MSSERDRLGPMSDSPAILSRPIILPVDGRQSAVASGIQRGVRRLFSELGHVTLPEFTLANGRRADLIALAPDGALTIVEVKSSVADFRADRKWPDYEDFATGSISPCRRPCRSTSCPRIAD